MIYLKDISEFIFLCNEPKKADIIFVPGGEYSEIAEEAARLWKEEYAPYVLPSGRYGKLLGSFSGVASKNHIYNKEYETEWEFLKDVLIKNGVKEKAILKEDKATFTYENALYSKMVTDKLDMEIKTAIICCKSFHARRCLMYYETVYENTNFIICPSEVKGINKGNWFTSEDGIDTVLGELERCGNQFKDIFKDKYIRK